MIEKVEIITNMEPQTELEKSILRVFNGVTTKLNEVIDVINAIQKEREAERFEIQEWIGILEAVRKSVNIHEKQIDELQMKVEPEKATISKMENVEPYAEQRKWIGKMCQFWDYAYEHDYFDTLKGITDDGLFIGHNGSWKHCKPIKSDDDIIYKGE